ncbi:carboxypeptidase-like regulatory domain-containing protein [Algoriphagus mannitolivorans]|uniref:carboxypeptidase-like regulatory domain-containing protein n=1 Tax=Algoriphagus mannitolivorans TaxID=226504 RepID=UPI0012F7848B|nr:carboxypeptidase-like regulatory domain-containing protein [Algoriphagus mannitolivorans]
MRFLWIGLLLLFSTFLNAQTISGIVTEKGTGKPLPFANVFINNSTLGAATDMEGKFSISGNIPEEFELVASFVGFRTATVLIQRKGRQSYTQNFELVFLEDQLSEVELKAKRDRGWERNLKKFKEVFLAVPDDPYGRDIELLNPWVLDFETIKPDKGFNYTQASAQLPLKIVNKALGYQIDFYLQDFRMLRNASRFFGQAFYKELEPENSTQENEWKDGKELNYLNSVRHLALSLLLRNATSQGFELYLTPKETELRVRTNDFTIELNQSIIPIKMDSLYSKPLGNGSYRIFLPGRIEVHHKNKPWPSDYYTNIYHAISWLVAPSGYFDVDRNGTLMHPTQLVLSGYMGRQRLARSLPLDFIPDENFEGFVEDLVTFQSRYKMLNNLREKPWISLNKAFYHPGETLWLGGRMLYQNTLMQDSLSRVVHVDILNSKLEPVFQETFQVQRGKIEGGMKLPESLEPGDYLLRAYTRWGLNFPEKDIFQLPFPVISRQETMVNSLSLSEAVFGDIKVEHQFQINDSLNYRVLELSLDFRDGYDNPVEAEVILSATEGDIPIELDSNTRLENSLRWLDEPLPETFDTELVYAIDYGISIEGQYFPEKKKDSKAAEITLVKGDLEDYGVVNSDSSGRFWATGLVFFDTATISIAALDDKLRPKGKVQLIPFHRPDFRGSFPRAKYSTKTIPDKAESLLDLAGDFILLEEFVKEGEKERETMEERNYGYGEPNQQVGPADLETKTWAEILGLLRFNINTLKFRNYTFGEKTGSPLLIIDGVSMPFLEPVDFRDRILSYEPSQLRSIKVYNDNISNVVFGMSGYAGVIMIETKNGSRFEPDSGKKFNSEGFQTFKVRGFTGFSQFPNVPPMDQYLRPKATLYFNPLGKVENGHLQTKIYIPYGTDKINLRIEGLTQDGEPIYRVIPLELGIRN